MRRGRAPLATLVVLALLTAAPARAALQWYQSYEEGLRAAEEGAWETALGHFQEAARTRRTPAERVRTYGNQFLFDDDPLYQQARCLAELARLDEARGLLREAEAAGVTDAPALAALGARLEALESRVRPEESAAGTSPVEADAPPPDSPAHAVLAVRSTPAAARVTVDGRRVGLTPLAGIAVEPGRHRVELRLDGREPWSESVDLGPGERLRLDVALASPRPPGPPEAAAPEAEEAAIPAAPHPPPAGRAEEPDEGPDAAVAASAERDTRESRPAGRSSGAAPEAAERTEPPKAPSGDGPAAAAVPAGGWTSPWLAALAGAAALAVAGGAAARSRRRRAPRPASLPGRVGRYRVTGDLGRGGMATTYRAVRVRDGLPVALKIPHETGDPTYLSRFLREGRLGETLHHPRIVRIVEAGEEAGRPFLALELIPGRTLREALDEAGGSFPLRRGLEIARDMAEALDYAHGKGVVHRDLKPENVMLLPDGTVKVMDFGVARVEGQPGLTSSSFFFGSPVYAAPELVDPPSIDHRADLYSLGVVLFELLEGQPPFRHESMFKLLEMHQHAPLPDPGALPHPLPEDVWLVLRHLLAKDPAARYADAQELLVDLERLLYELPG